MFENTFLFWEAGVVLNLCQKAEACESSKLIRTYVEEITGTLPTPSLWLIKDFGVCLRPNIEGNSKGVFAEGCDPSPENRQHIISICGKDSFTEAFPCKDIRGLWAKNIQDHRKVGFPPPDLSNCKFQVEIKPETIEIGFCGK